MKKKAAGVVALILLAFMKSFGQEECALTETWKSGSTNQGGYSFNYQSNHGKDCRVYRVQNRPGRLLTPLLWKDSREIYIKTNLSECKGNMDCPWVSVTKPSFRADDGETMLWFGFNFEQYKESPEAYREHQMRSDFALYLPPLITTVRGIIADASGKSFELGIRVASLATRKESGQYELTYEISNISEFGALQISELGAPGPLNVVWDPTITGQLFLQLQKRKRALPIIAPGADKLVVKFVASAIEVDESRQLIVYSGANQVFATSARAYRRPQG